MGSFHDHAAPEVVGSGFLEGRDARAKLGCALILVLATVLAPREPWRLLALAGVACAFASVGATAFHRILLRAAIVLPFALAGSVFLPFMEKDGLAHAADIAARAYVSGIAVSAVASSTELPDLVNGLSAFLVPRAVVVTASFTVRYLVLLREEARRLMLARELRTFGWRPALALRAMGWSIGTLFIRTFERAERVHASMAARGFDGTFPVLGRRALDGADLLLVLLVVLGAAGGLFVKAA
ncbi:MAG TPA: energy-coupling factor transporter transmembrane component T [Planctomycetota bacterium]|nr:energy-coupling factor transporter transmembrane component T [Planctomycetota bacterium]